jgi:glycosyltransferase involved in cell wall biosynthesis
VKIALVHNFYSSRVPSGENQMVKQQYDVLGEAGHEIRLISFDNDVSINSFLDKLLAAFTTSTAYGKSPQKRIRPFCPDIILVNNLFPNIGSHWLKTSQVPVVAILHNYRYFCATGLNFRDNKQCFDCSDKSPLEGLRNRCYRNSFLATLPLTVAQIRREHLYDELEGFDYFVALSEGSRDKLVGAGLASEKTCVIPNFIDDFSGNKKIDTPAKNGRWIAVGRISIDKGFLNLIENWPQNYELDIVGDGPEMQELITRTENKKNIRLLGQLDREVILRKLPEYSGAIHPSLMLEVCPLTVIEFLCAGLPIITLKSNTSAVGLVEGNAGIALDTFTKDSLRHSLESIDENYELFAKNARLNYLKHYTKNSWLARMNSLMDEIVENHKKRKNLN